MKLPTGFQLIGQVVGWFFSLIHRDYCWLTEYCVSFRSSCYDMRYVNSPLESMWIDWQSFRLSARLERVIWWCCILTICIYLLDITGAVRLHQVACPLFCPATAMPCQTHNMPLIRKVDCTATKTLWKIVLMGCSLTFWTIFRDMSFQWMWANIIFHVLIELDWWGILLTASMEKRSPWLSPTSGLRSHSWRARPW